MQARTILMALYSTGMRRSELVHLRVEDIDSERMVLHIRKGKGGTDDRFRGGANHERLGQFAGRNHLNGAVRLLLLIRDRDLRLAG